MKENVNETYIYTIIYIYIFIYYERGILKSKEYIICIEHFYNLLIELEYFY